MTAIDREQIWSDFLQQKLPSRKNEAWKYSDLSILAPWQTALKLDAKSYQAEIDILRIPDTLLLVFLNGYYMPMLSDHAKFSAQIFIGNSTQQPLMQQKFQAHLQHAIDENKYPFATINRDLYTDDFVLALPDQYELKTPVNLPPIRAA
jgi:Fe-S cluster assembly protein SufD